MKAEFDLRTLMILIGIAASFGMLGGALAEHLITPIIQQRSSTEIRVHQSVPSPYRIDPQAETISHPFIHTLALQND